MQKSMIENKEPVLYGLLKKSDYEMGFESKAERYFNETDINPPAELGRLADASGDEQSTRIKTPAV